MDIKSTFGLKIRALRKQRQLSQAQLAELVERSTESVSNLERGISLPSVETLIKLSEALNVQVQYFFESEKGESVSKTRSVYLAELQAIAYKLSDSNLELAIKQMRAFNQSR